MLLYFETRAATVRVQSKTKTNFALWPAVGHQGFERKWIFKVPHFLVSEVSCCTNLSNLKTIGKCAVELLTIKYISRPFQEVRNTDVGWLKGGADGPNFTKFGDRGKSSRRTRRTVYFICFTQFRSEGGSHWSVFEVVVKFRIYGPSRN